MTRTFRHSGGGTDPELWAGLRAGLAELRVPGVQDRMLLVAAHPDDETLGAGGLLAAADANGASIVVVIATDGDASHPDSPTHDAADLAAIRRREVCTALAILAPSAQVHLLGLPDGRLAQHENELAERLARLATGCTHLVTPWSHDRHPDHEACARAGSAALGKSVGAAADGRPPIPHWQYPIWAWHWGDPEAADLPRAGLHRLTLAPAAQQAKERAIAAYASQCTPLSDQAGDEAVLTPRMLAHFRGDCETYVLAPATAAGAVAVAVAPDYFSELYRRSDDPWGLRERFYEQRKRAAILAALTRPSFRRVFEPGCATGLLTAELARRCAEVIAWDIVPAAVDSARERLADLPNAVISAGRIPEQWPSGTFDLVLLSEVGYYCADLTALVVRVDACLADDGVLVACHWRHAAPMHPHNAGAVHKALGEGRQIVVSHVEEDFLLQVWSRSGRSVAAAEGILA